MTERKRSAGERTADHYRIGPSSLRWENGELIVDIDEIAVPHLSRVRGRVRIIPEALNARVFDLDNPRRHHWRTIAPIARAEVEMENPAQRWSGSGYVDTNWGEEPLEAGFPRWDWSRAEGKSGCTVLYDATRRDGTDLSLGLRFDRKGGLTEVTPPPRMALPTTLWRVKRSIQSETTPKELKRLEDAPFYARAEIETTLHGERVRAVHETVDGNRFGSRWVKVLLPFRMPRTL
jgi:carotenoid 1,2-hydratase